MSVRGGRAALAVIGMFMIAVPMMVMGVLSRSVRVQLVKGTDKGLRSEQTQFFTTPCGDHQEEHILSKAMTSLLTPEAKTRKGKAKDGNGRGFGN